MPSRYEERRESSLTLLPNRLVDCFAIVRGLQPSAWKSPFIPPVRRYADPASSLCRKPCLGSWRIRGMRCSKDSTHWELLHSRPELVEQAIEELLRAAGLTRVLFRIALNDVELSGCRIRQGERVLLRVIAANHDPERFSCPHQTDITAYRGGPAYLRCGPACVCGCEPDSYDRLGSDSSPGGALCECAFGWASPLAGRFRVPLSDGTARRPGKS